MEGDATVGSQDVKNSNPFLDRPHQVTSFHPSNLLPFPTMASNRAPSLTAADAICTQFPRADLASLTPAQKWETNQKAKERERHAARERERVDHLSFYRDIVCFREDEGMAIAKAGDEIEMKWEKDIDNDAASTGRPSWTSVTDTEGVDLSSASFHTMRTPRASEDEKGSPESIRSNRRFITPPSISSDEYDIRGRRRNRDEAIHMDVQRGSEGWDESRWRWLLRARKRHRSYFILAVVGGPILLALLALAGFEIGVWMKSKIDASSTTISSEKVPISESSSSPIASPSSILVPLDGVTVIYPTMTTPQEITLPSPTATTTLSFLFPSPTEPPSRV